MTPRPSPADARYRLIHGDCLDVMRTMDAASVDAVVTDPPYGLGFMGKKWDEPGAMVERRAATENAWDHVGGNHNPTCSADSARTKRSEGVKFQKAMEAWSVEALRVAKPGAHLLAFGGTRTFHRLTCAIEDAGWEIRDCLSWLYSTGFPKSHNFGCRCHRREYVNGIGDGQLLGVRQADDEAGLLAQADDERNVLAQVQWGKKGSGVGGARAQGPGGVDGREPIVVPVEDERPAESGVEGRRDAQAAEGKLLGRALRQGPGVGAADGESGRVCDGASVGDGDRAGSTADSDGGRSPSESPALGQPTGQPRTVRVERRAQAGGSDVCEKCGGLKSARGYGTALKPAWEPVILARKPLVGTVAANYAAHGTGALNIDGCRIGTDERFNPPAGNDGTSSASVAPVNVTDYSGRVVTGRWPANVVLDEEAAKALDEQSGGLQSGSRADGTYGMMGFNGNGEKPMPAIDGDFGGASRFFYVAKASRAEREAGLREAGLREANVQSGCAGDMPTDDDGADRDRFKVRARNTHPTVKPVDLMRWLVRLVTPTGGVVLDPFTGSGTTGIAAIEEGCSFIGIEREAEYVAIAEARLRHAAASPMLPFAPTQVAETVPMQFDPVMP